MRRPLSIIAAAAIIAGASAVSLSSTASATPRLAPGATDTTNGAVIQVQSWENFHGDRHNAFRDDGWNDGWRPRRHLRNRHFSRHRRHHFGFPFAFRPRFYPYNSYGDCFRTWDGQLICRGY
jgi:hypothetical protein